MAEVRAAVVMVVVPAAMTVAMVAEGVAVREATAAKVAGAVVALGSSLARA